jgi:Ca2+/Na+ antiporter
MKVSLMAVLAPSFGPAVFTLFGVNIPIITFAMSCIGLLLAREIGPEPTRKLTRRQNVALTSLLLVITFMFVTGSFGMDQPERGVAVAFSIGLGFSGLLAVQIFGDFVIARLKAMLGRPDTPPAAPE